MKLKLLLAHTTNRFYVITGYNIKAVLRYQPKRNIGFYLGSTLKEESSHLNTQLKKL